MSDFRIKGELRSTEQDSRRSPFWNLAFIVAVALAARLAYLLFYRDSPLFDLYLADQIYYRDWAIRIAGGDWLGNEVFEQGPLYAYLLGGFFRLFGTQLTPVLIVQAIAGTATVALVWWCTRHLAGDRAGVAAGLLAAIYGPLVFYDVMLMKNFLEPLLVVAALAAFLQGTAIRRWAWHAASGLAIALACLLREVHALLLVPLLLGTLLIRSDEPTAWCRRFLPAVALLGGFLLTLAPTTLRNLVVAGEPVPVTTGGGEVAYMSFGPTANGYYAPPYFVSPHPVSEHQDFRREAYFRTLTPMGRTATSAYWYRETWREVAAAPERIPGLLARKLVILFNDDEVPDSENYAFTSRLIPLLRLLPTFGWISGFGLLGAVLLWRKGETGRMTAGFALLLVVEILLTYNFGRFRLALSAVWLICAGVAIAHLFKEVALAGSNWLRKVAAWAVVLVLAAAVAWRPAPRTAMASNQAAQEQLALEAAAKRAAIPALQRQAAERPNDPDPVYYLGVAYWATGMLSEARTTYAQVLRLRPDDPDTHRDLAQLHRYYGETALTLHHAETLATLMPRDFLGHYLAGIALLDRGVNANDPVNTAADFRAASAKLQQAAMRQPDDAGIRLALARARYYTGDPETALQELAAALAIDPNSAQAYFDRQWIAARIH